MTQYSLFQTQAIHPAAIVGKKMARMTSPATLRGGVSILWRHRVPSALANSEPLEITAIIGLLFSRCPSAISRFVVAVVVDAVDCESSRFRTHIREEVFKLLPPFANCYSTPAVILEALAFGIATAVKHRTPRVVFVSSLSARCVSVSSKHGTDDFSLQASTTSSFSRSQCSTLNNRHATTIAQTGPRSLQGFIATGKIHHCQSPKFSALHFNSYSLGHGNTLHGERQ